MYGGEEWFDVLKGCAGRLSYARVVLARVLPYWV